MDNLVIFSGNANKELAKEICQYLGVELGRAYIDRFPDSEVKVSIENDVRGKDVFFIQPTCPPVNENLMELLVTVDALKRASASRITTVIPYYGYARQDRKHEGRVPITAKLVANLLTVAGANRILTMDLHSTQIQGFFDIPVDHLFSAPIFIEYLKSQNIPDLVIMSPDVGGSKMCDAFAKHLRCGFAIGDKRRLNDTNAVVENIIGDVKDKNVVIVDDMITTAGTIREASIMAFRYGAKSVRIVGVHPVFCGNAFDRLASINAEQILVSNSIPVDKKKIEEYRLNIKILSVGKLLAEAIKRIHKNRSVSELFM